MVKTMTDKYLLFDLQDDKSKEIATLLSNESARKILSYLSEHPASESDLSKALNIPLSTVHYNVQNLLRNELIMIKDSLYSQKGNKIHVYETARRAIVLAPKNSSFWSLARGPLSFIGIAGVISLILYYTSPPTLVESLQAGQQAMMDSAVAESETFAAKALAAPAAPPIPDHNIALWFFAGAVLVAVLSFGYNYWRMKK